MHLQCNQQRRKKRMVVAQNRSCSSSSAFKRKNSVYINISSGLWGIEGAFCNSLFTVE